MEQDKFQRIVLENQKIMLAYIGTEFVDSEAKETIRKRLQETNKALAPQPKGCEQSNEIGYEKDIEEGSVLSQEEKQ